MTKTEAETIAAEALLWLAADPELAAIFLSSTGAEAADLRQNARDPAFLGFVLDFILQSDEHVLAVADHCAIRPEKIAEARQALPGGALPHWT